MVMLKKILALFVMLYAAVAMAASVDVNKATDAQLDAVKGIRPAVGARDAVDPDLPRVPAGHAESTMLSAVRQDAGGHRLEEAHAAHAAVAALPLAFAARTLPDRVALQPHREAELEHLRVRQ